MELEDIVVRHLKIYGELTPEMVILTEVHNPLAMKQRNISMNNLFKLMTEFFEEKQLYYSYCSRCDDRLDYLIQAVPYQIRQYTVILYSFFNKTNELGPHQIIIC